MEFKTLPVQKTNLIGHLGSNLELVNKHGDTSMIWWQTTPHQVKHHVVWCNCALCVPGHGEKNIRFFQLYFSVRDSMDPLLPPHLMSNTALLPRVIQPWYFSDIHVKYLKDLPYTWHGKHVHLAASSKMFVISMRLTCVGDDTYT